MSLSPAPTTPKQAPLTVCQKCLYLGKIQEFLKEKNLPAPFETASEIFLECPKCQDKTHASYTTSELREHQQKLAIRMRSLKEQRDRGNKEAVAEFQRLQQEYHEAFDGAQLFFRTVLEKIVVEDGTGK